MLKRRIENEEENENDMRININQIHERIQIVYMMTILTVVGEQKAFHRKYLDGTRIALHEEAREIATQIGRAYKLEYSKASPRGLR